MEFMIGCNYWGSKWGTDMWKNWDAESVRNDFSVLSQNGVKYMRVFPNWRDFQPVMEVKVWGGKKGGYLFYDETEIDNEFAIDYTKMEYFSSLCDYAKEFGIKLVVSVLTGWMSGRLFVPRVIESKNLICDSEALMWETKFVKGFVRYFKDRDEIVAWDLGNECNCMGVVESRADAYTWTSMIRNTIYCEDNSRPIMSGMHALTTGTEWPGNNNWTIQDQGELTDILTPHPYPSPTVGADREHCNTMRPTLIPLAHVNYYSGIGKKTAIIQESGTFSQMIANEEASADFMRASLLGGWANGSLGYLWWCAHEQLHLDTHPYSEYMMERELGLLHEDLTPKKVALEMKRVGEMLNSLPFNKLPERDTEAVVLLSKYQSAFSNFTTSFILAKQAGFDVTCRYCEQEIPDAKLYIVPSIRGWEPFGKKFIETLKEKAKNGATVIISNSCGLMSEFSEIMGIESLGRGKEKLTDTFQIGEKTLEFNYGDYKIDLNPIKAKVLLSASDKNPLLIQNDYGKGKIYYLNFPVEEMLGNAVGTINHPDEKPYYLIYKLIAKDILGNRLVTTDNPFISITQHRFDEKSAVIVAMNNSDKTQNCGFDFSKVKNAEILYGDKEKIDKCDAVIMKVEF